MGLKIRQASQLKGKVLLPGDKSLSHRALILAALAEGISRIENCLVAGVTEAMIDCLRAMCVDVKIEGRSESSVVVIGGRKLHGLMAPEAAFELSWFRYHHAPARRCNGRSIVSLSS